MLIEVFSCITQHTHKYYKIITLFLFMNLKMLHDVLVKM